jgi:CRISPR-associated exonuclease Cas4
MGGGTEPIPISALQHAVYCLRKAALIHLERLWSENRFTAEGAVLHAVADKGGRRQARGIRRVMALPIASRRLNLAGVADVVEFPRTDDRELPCPIEHKRGRAKAHWAVNVWPAPSARGLSTSASSLRQRIRPRSTLPAKMEIRAT